MDKFFRPKPALLWIVLIFFLTQPLDLFSVGSHKLLITEIMAINGSGLKDEDGDFSDWIEIHNPGTESINLSGWSLSDNPENPGKWIFPTMNLSAGQYLVVFASEKGRANPSGNLHTNFKLSGSGEYLVLIEPDLKTISYSFGESFPVQQKDVSYGLYQGNLVFFNQPTPGAENQSGNQVLEAIFSKERGFYQNSFQVEITAPQSGCQIYYTTNGTRPDKTKGTLYTLPITINTTTPLSAVVYNSDNKASSVVSHTYLFIDSIMHQPANPAGYPSEWSPLSATVNAPSDYEMDPEICLNPSYQQLIDDALLAIPTISVVTDISNLFSRDTNPSTGGIYIYTGDCGASPSNLGSNWERPTSVEYIDPAKKVSFQVNCGIRLHGGNSRKPGNSQKHSFRISFRSDYGPSKLNYNLFEKRDPVNQFDDLVLRAGYNYSWIKNTVGSGVQVQRVRADYVRDPFTKNTQLDMGNIAAHNRFVHLYLNGLYWGVYNVSEKITADFVESYMGGQDEDFDVLTDQKGVVEGNFNAWDKMISQVNAGFSTVSSYYKIQGKNSAGEKDSTIDELLDIENFIDYMLLNFYIGNQDWDKNNWLVARDRVKNNKGFQFFAWDAETSMLDKNLNQLSMNNSGNPTGICTKLRKNEEFKLKFADRIQKHFFNEGALTSQACINRYTELINEIDLPIIAESARWGDYRRDVTKESPADLYTRNDYWLPETQSQLKNYLPQRSSILLQQFKDAGLFPALQAPVFSHNGGTVENPIDLKMTAAEGDIYFTIDKSDPREAGGAIHLSGAKKYSAPIRIIGEGTLKARAKKGDLWSAVTVAKFKGGDTLTFVLSTPELVSSIETSCYPNPFNQLTHITYQLAQTGPVKLEIAGLDGRIIEVLYDGIQTAGLQNITWQPVAVKPGIYLYRLKAGRQALTGKLIYRK